MIRREVVGRYQGSAAGVLWSFLNPLFMLVVYAFVFSVVFKARWNVTGDESRTQFALVLFSGLIVHSFASECLMRAPRLVIDNANYVKRVVFPLEILPIVTAGSALFHAAVSYAVLLAGLLFFNGDLPVTAALLPLVLAPLCIGLLGLMWFFASLGVFARDIQQLIGMAMTALLFLTPIFFPATALPEDFRVWMYLNPLTLFVEQSRDVLVWGKVPAWAPLLLAYVAAIVLARLGYAWFQRTRKGFADVL
ncbi:ABC transporter permease [Pseudorhodoferax sp. Leaf267]|uniref:ABC transporter permease n=1 Tax=Pseudorhodoferax sp. Leaf267 TaxID=1736316 RepID=UPI0009EB9402